MQLQLTITFALIAATAIIALICDYLRARNAKLRQALAELEASNQARLKAAEERKQTVDKAGTATLTTRPVRPIQRPPHRQSKQQATKSNTVLSEWLIQRGVVRATQKPAEQSRPAALPAAPGTVPELTPAPDRVLKPFAVPARPVPVSIDGYLWASLTGEELPAASAGRTSTTLELIQGSGAGSWTSKLDLEVTAGMHTASALEQLTQNRKLFTGLVISIGVDQNEAGRSRNEDSLQSIGSFIRGLLREADFGCRVGYDEFLLICPGPHGAEAQQRLSQVSERLWDFQLRTLHKFSIQFSVGGFDVQRESVSGAIAMAKTRMGQTRRNRNMLSLSVAPQRRIPM